MPKLPDELTERLTDLMGEIAAWVCEESGKPQVLTMFHCIHDKDLGAALMAIDIRVGEGLKWAVLGEKKDEPGPISEPPDKVAEDLISQMMKAAKEKGGGSPEAK